MNRITYELTRRDLPYTVTKTEGGAVVLYAQGYSPLLYYGDEYEIDGVYLATNAVFKLNGELSALVPGAVAGPHFDYKSIAESSGLGVRGANDLIFTEKFGSLCVLGAVFVKGDFEERKLIPPSLPCDKCGKCVRSCPTNALCGGFKRADCIREQMDSGIKESVAAVLGKSLLGCNSCSINCPNNKPEYMRPPVIMQKILKADYFIEAALSGRKALMPLAELIGYNYIRPAKMLTLAVYGMPRLEVNLYEKLNKLEKYPDERVRKAVEFVRGFYQIR